ncbi:MAG: C39 family peptidase [Candidatus Aenigmarchaeota archaeon]|nr:C39 family peptidase [Candidatus Aenigmarchaeota archaeon]
MLSDGITYKIVLCFAVLLAGFIISKIGERLITYLWRRKYRVSIERVQIAHIYALGINILAIVIALSFLKINITENTLVELYSYFPFVLSIVLLGILIVLLVRVVFFAIDKFLSTSGLKDIVEEYDQEQNMTNFLFILKYVLYVVFGLIALTSLGINIDSTVLLFKGILYPLLIFGLVILFVGIKPYVENTFSGLFLKKMNFLRVGEKIKIKKEIYTISALKKQGLLLKTKTNYNMFIPYKRVYEEQVTYREIMYDLATLEKIKNHFLAQYPSHCGPASVSIVLKIFGHNIGQEEIAKQTKTVVPKQKRLDGTKIPGGTKPKDLIRAVEKLTKNKVKGVWINIDRINDLKMELKTWLNNKALIIIDYKKSFLFPEAKTAHYSVCFSIRGEELLIIDPGLKKGGVYYADIKKVYLGMNTYSELLKEKRGYIVLAPKGTTAYHRIEEGLIYSDPDLYRNLNNNLTKELNRLMQKAGKLEDILPKSIKKIVDDYKKKEKVTRVWRPKSN